MKRVLFAIGVGLILLGSVDFAAATMVYYKYTISGTGLMFYVAANGVDGTTPVANGLLMGLAAPSRVGAVSGLRATQPMLPGPQAPMPG